MEGNGNLKVRPTLAKALICAGARYWCITPTSSYNGIHRFSNKEGAGKLNAKCAASILSAGRYYYTAEGYTGDEPITKKVNLTSADAVLKICLTWEKRNLEYSDGTVANIPLSNWNLSILNPDGVVVYSSASTKNNVEMIYFSPTVYGEYTIKASKISGSASSEYVSIAWY